ncbi:MAG: hypothetical protein VB031_06540 [Eubacteriaceae bacterium]|nr:hypothetical protein [Eubacteriaceae bacterium]
MNNEKEKEFENENGLDIPIKLRLALLAYFDMPDHMKRGRPNSRFTQFGEMADILDSSFDRTYEDIDVNVEYWERCGTVEFKTDEASFGGEKAKAFIRALDMADSFCITYRTDETFSMGLTMIDIFEEGEFDKMLNEE